MTNKTKSEKCYTNLSIEEQQAIRGWGDVRPPRIKRLKVPRSRQK